MNYRKIILRVILVSLVVGLMSATWYAWDAFPIISGYGAKNLCSAVYLQHRHPEDVIREDLGDFPLSLGSYTVNMEDSSVTGSVWGFAKKKAIYRKGVGCTIINDITEKELRAQHFTRPSMTDRRNDTAKWPVGEAVPDSLPARVNKQEMDLALSNAFNDMNNGKSTLTRAIVVIYDGQLVTEKYAPGFDKNTVMLGWSISKSLTGTLIGLLVRDGKLKLDEPAPVPEWKGNDREKITLRQLLQQTSGLDFNEVYTGPSEVTNMLFKTGDMAAFTARLGLKYQPGTVFNYSSGNSNILSRIIRQTVGEKDYAAFPYTALFYKANMYSILLEPDASGTYIGSSYSYGTARDFAKLGLLYYNNGKWNGEQLLPENWVSDAIQPSRADKLKHYGFQFWLNGMDEKDPSKRRYPDVPPDMYYADGYGGQDIYIIPSRKLVIVRMGLHVINENKFLREVMAAIH